MRANWSLDVVLEDPECFEVLKWVNDSTQLCCCSRERLLGCLIRVDTKTKSVFKLENPSG